MIRGAGGGAAGTHTVVLGPGDVATDIDFGNTEVIVPVADHQFDFGTSGSPVASGYTQVTEATSYSVAQGYGWLSGSPVSRDRGTGTDLERDFNFVTGAGGTFAVDVASSGSYSVTVVIGDATVAHPDQGVFLEGVQVDTVSTAAGEFYTQSYVTTVSDGQLTVGL